MVLDGAALDRLLHGEATDPKRYLERFGYDPPDLAELDDTASPAEAEVNHGRWIWHCACRSGTDEVPRGGGVVFVDDPVGWCPRCRNEDVAGRWRPLRLPAERTSIERVLAMRPEPESRNWWPGETVAELVAENADNGIGDVGSEAADMSYPQEG
jgi:hypothetical protein